MKKKNNLIYYLTNNQLTNQNIRNYYKIQMLLQNSSYLLNVYYQCQILMTLMNNIILIHKKIYQIHQLIITNYYYSKINMDQYNYKKMF